MSVSTDSDSDGDGVPDGFEVDEEDTQQSSGGQVIDWSSIAPSWLQGNTATVLRDFAEAPVGFAAGIVLNIIVGGLENVTEAVISALYVLYEGSSRGSAAGMLGVADIPRVAANTLGSVGRVTGSALLDALTQFFETVESAAGAAGSVAPIIAAIAVAVVILAVAYLARFAWTLLVDSLNPL